MKFIKSTGFVYPVLLVTIFLLYTFGLYGAIRGNLGPTFSPLQPDSIQYICRGLKLANLDSTVIDSYMNTLTRYFRSTSDDALGCGSTSLLYQSRLFLPFLISLTSVIGSVWALFLPTIFIVAASITLWWRLTKLYVSQMRVIGTILGIAPWVSPHFGGHAFLVLTEGPLIFFILCLLFATDETRNTYVYVFTLFVIPIMSVLNRQSWPIIGIILAYSISTRYHFYSRLKILLIFVLSNLVCLSVSSFLTTSISQSIPFSELLSAMHGILMGLLFDLIHLFKFFDIPGIIVLSAVGIVIFNVKRFEVQLASVLLLIVSLYSQGGIYLYDGSFSQNWRYYLPNGFFAVYVFLKYFRWDRYFKISG